MMAGHFFYLNQSTFSITVRNCESLNELLPALFSWAWAAVHPLATDVTSKVHPPPITHGEERINGHFIKKRLVHTMLYIVLAETYAHIYNSKTFIRCIDIYTRTYIHTHIYIPSRSMSQ